MHLSTSSTSFSATFNYSFTPLEPLQQLGHAATMYTVPLTRASPYIFRKVRCGDGAHHIEDSERRSCISLKTLLLYEDGSFAVVHSLPGGAVNPDHIVVPPIQESRELVICEQLKEVNAKAEAAIARWKAINTAAGAERENEAEDEVEVFDVEVSSDLAVQLG